MMGEDQHAYKSDAYTFERLPTHTFTQHTLLRTADAKTKQEVWYPPCFLYIPKTRVTQVKEKSWIYEVWAGFSLPSKYISVFACTHVHVQTHTYA